MIRFVISLLSAALFLSGQDVGIFEKHADVGETPKAGSVEYDAVTGEYRVTGGGANIWASVDAFQFAWKRVSGDVTITADVRFIGTGAVDHRKAVLMIRQNLNPDSVYADVALHGDGLTSLQFRPKAAAATEELRSPLKMPVRIRIERHGNQFTIYAGSRARNWQRQVLPPWFSKIRCISALVFVRTMPMCWKPRYFRTSRSSPRRSRFNPPHERVSSVTFRLRRFAPCFSLHPASPR